MATRLGARDSRLALSGSRRILSRDHRDDNSLRLVNHAQRSIGRAVESKPDNEPVESSLVFSGVAGDACLFRPMDFGRGDAQSTCRWIDGLSIC